MYIKCQLHFGADRNEIIDGLTKEFHITKWKAKKYFLAYIKADGLPEINIQTYIKIFYKTFTMLALQINQTQNEIIDELIEKSGLPREQVETFFIGYFQKLMENQWKKY